MKPKSPSNYSSLNSPLGGERDVLLDMPRKEPRIRTSIIGDKKLTTRDAFERRDSSERETLGEEKSGREAGSHVAELREPEWQETPKPEATWRHTTKRSNNVEHSIERSAATKRNYEAPPKLEAPPKVEKRNSILFDDANASRTEKIFHREHGYSKASPQGSSPVIKEGRQKVSRRLIYRGFGLMLLLCTFASIAYFVSEPVAKLLERPLKSVAVEGRFQYFPKDRAMELIMAEIDGNFLQLKLEHLKSVLQADPWVEHVFLSRRWPDTLVVKIAEQQPIARWDADGFLNQRGEIIRVKEVDKLVGLPWLQGNEINAREIMQQYQDLSTLLRARGLEIIALKCDNKKSWRITLKNDVEIAIGRDQVMEKMRRFVTVYDNFLNSVWLDVKSIDVRYTNGVSVRWAPDSVMAKKYLKHDSVVKPSVVKSGDVNQKL